MIFRAFLSFHFREGQPFLGDLLRRDDDRLFQARMDTADHDKRRSTRSLANLKRSGNSAAASSYDSNAIDHREAWDFSIPQSVKILANEPAKHRVKVEMKTPGRMLGSVWFLDTDALE